MRAAAGACALWNVVAPSLILRWQHCCSAASVAIAPCYCGHARFAAVFSAATIANNVLDQTALRVASLLCPVPCSAVQLDAGHALPAPAALCWGGLPAAA